MTDLPRELPKTPEGWTRQLVSHLNLGAKGGIGTYAIFDETGKEMPIQFGYRSGHEPYRGFFFYGSNECLTWAELRKRWPRFVTVRERMEAANKPVGELGAVGLPMIVIYDHPKDLPAGFVVRSWNVYPDRVALNRILGQDLPTLDDARAIVPAGMVNVGRRDEDDPKIAEVWV